MDPNVCKISRTLKQFQNNIYITKIRIKHVSFKSNWWWGILFLILLSLLTRDYQGDKNLEEFENLPENFKNFSRDFQNLNVFPENNKENIGCVFPQFPEGSKLPLKWNPASYKQDCRHVKNLLVINGSKISKLPGVREDCCVHEIVPMFKNYEIRITPCKPLVSGVEVNIRGMEFVLVKCGSFYNFHAQIPMRRAVQEKTNYWKSIPTENRPFNVLIVGIDTVSRVHAQRSLPQTLKLLKQLGFLDFEGFHSLGPNTLTNLMPLLSGLSLPEARKTCSMDWKTSFDSCPFIWNKLNNWEYVTGYIEDGADSTTFDWGGQAGFSKKPTDYYLQQLFLAVKQVGFNRPQKNGKLPWPCVTTETNPEFLLRYTRQWLKKFGATPFFLLTWLNSPFQEDPQALPNFDEFLLRLLDNKHPEFLQKTLIILLSNHGERYGDYKSEPIENYFFQRSLPPLWLRIPDQLPTLKKFQNVPGILQINSKKLVTPLDLHHTLTHLLSIVPGMNLVIPFQTHAADRSSLFASIPWNRTCKSTGIKSNCVCNLNPDLANSTIEAGLSSELLEFSLESLNGKVKKLGKEGEELCLNWTSPKLVDGKYILRGETHDEALMVFQVSPGNAQFESRLKITGNFGNHTVKLVYILRVSSYRLEGWCIPSVTDQDKEMKSLCKCKPRKAR